MSDPVPTAIIDVAYLAAAEQLRGACVAAGFLAEGQSLFMDPDHIWEPEVAEIAGAGQQLTAAALFKLSTRPMRQLSGGDRSHFVVERDIRIELASVGAISEDLNHEDRLGGALDLIAVIDQADPTLGGLCERWWLTGLEDDDLAPSGAKKLITFTIRLRSADRLGRTPVTGVAA